MNEQTLKEKRGQFLVDTIAYYSKDVKRRCTSGITCAYSPKSVGKEGISEGCAIGRHMTPANQVKADAYAEFNNSSVDKIDEKLIPKKLINLGIPFLVQMQRLHDASQNWDEDGLTVIGKQKVGDIVEEFGLDNHLVSVTIN